MTPARRKENWKTLFWLHGHRYIIILLITKTDHLILLLLCTFSYPASNSRQRKMEDIGMFRVTSFSHYEAAMQMI